MKNLEYYKNSVMNDLESLDVPVDKSTIKNINVCKHHKSHWGRCKRKYNGLTKQYEYSIEIDEWLLQDDSDDRGLRDTLAHEIIHTINGCWSHRAPFQKWARVMDVLGYSIHTSATNEDYGFDNDDSEEFYKYRVSCVACGKNYYYSRRTKAIALIEHNVKDACRCPKCSGHDFEVTTLR